MLALFRFKSLIFGLSLILLAGILACGEGATPTPAAQPTQDVAAIVQQVLAQQEQPDVLTAADIQQLVQGVVTQALVDQPAPEGLTAQQVQDLVQNAIAATIQPGASALEVQTAIAAAVGAIQPGVSAEDVQAVVQQAVAGALAALPTPTSLASVEPTGTISFGVAQVAPSVWVPKNQSYYASQFEVTAFMEHMFTFGQRDTAVAAQIQPRLIEDFSTSIDSEGNWVYTFTQRQGVPFHTRFGLWGEVTADDWIFSLENTAAEGTIHSISGDVRRVIFCDGCELTKVDTYTFQLKRPEANYQVRWISTYPIGNAVGAKSKKHFDAVGEEVANTQPVGTAPWELVEDKTDVFRRLTAVQNHWRKTPEFDEMVWWVITEESTRLANFEAGLLDSGTFSTDSVQAVKNLDDPRFIFQRLSNGINHQLHLGGQQYYTDHPAHIGESAVTPLGENAYDCSLAWVSCDRDVTTEEWATARKVRLAMNLAIDRDALINNLAFGEGTPLYLHTLGGYREKGKEFGLDQLTYDFDPDRARQLMADAGYSDGFDIQMATNAVGQAAARPVMEAVATMWEAIGVRVEQIGITRSASRPERLKRTSKWVDDWSWGPASFEPIHHLGLIFDVSGLPNYGLEHPILQDLLDQAFTNQDAEERWGLYNTMMRFMFDESLVFPIFSEDLLYPLSEKLGNWPLLGPGSQAWLSNWENTPHR